MLAWPTEYDVLAYLQMVRFVWNTDGWRAMSEMAGHFECPDFARLVIPLSRLSFAADVENRQVDGGPTLYRAITEPPARA